MKIIFVSGSPRKQGNTGKILEIISNSIKDTFEIQTFHLSDLQVNGCLGCSHCQEILDEMEIHSFISGKPVGLVVSCQGPEEENTELIKAQFDKFCESSLTNCFGKYIFPWCDTNINNSQYSKETLELLIGDLQHLSENN